MCIYSGVVKCFTSRLNQLNYDLEWIERTFGSSYINFASPRQFLFSRFFHKTCHFVCVQLNQIFPLHWNFLLCFFFFSVKFINTRCVVSRIRIRIYVCRTLTIGKASKRNWIVIKIERTHKQTEKDTTILGEGKYETEVRVDQVKLLFCK